MNLIQTQIQNLIDKSTDITFSSNNICGSLTCRSQDDINLVKNFEDGDFSSGVQFSTSTYDYKIDTVINYTLSIKNTGYHYASYHSYIEHSLEQTEINDEAVVYEDNYNKNSEDHNTLLPFLVKIFRFVDCLKDHYYYRNSQIVIFAQTHCEIPIQPRQAERYLQIAKECSVSEGLIVAVDNFTHWLNADISNTDDEIKKSLLVHETERNTIVASVLLDNLVSQAKEDRIFSLLKNIESTYQLILSKYSLYLDDFKFSKFNDKIVEHAEKFLEKANDIITSLQTQILAIPVAIAIISVSKSSVEFNGLLVGSFLIYSLMVLYSSLQQCHNLWHLHSQIKDFGISNKMPETLLDKWNENIKPIKRKIIAHSIYLIFVVLFIIFIALNCLDYLFSWSIVLPLDLLIATKNP